MRTYVGNDGGDLHLIGVGTLQVAEMGFRSLFAHRYTTVNTLVMMVNWTVATMAYYGLSLNSVNLSGDIYVNFVLTALIEIPSYVFCVMVTFFLHSSIAAKICISVRTTTMITPR